MLRKCSTLGYAEKGSKTIPNIRSSITGIRRNGMKAMMRYDELLEMVEGNNYLSINSKRIYFF